MGDRHWAALTTRDGLARNSPLIPCTLSQTELGVSFVRLFENPEKIPIKELYSQRQGHPDRLRVDGNLIVSDDDESDESEDALRPESEHDVACEYLILNTFILTSRQCACKRKHL